MYEPSPTSVVVAFYLLCIRSKVSWKRFIRSGGDETHAAKTPTGTTAKRREQPARMIF
jgi:hypothetical protein